MFIVIGVVLLGVGVIGGTVTHVVIGCVALAVGMGDLVDRAEGEGR